MDDLIEKYDEIITKLKIFSDKTYIKYCLDKQGKTIKLGNVCKIITGKLNANACSNNGKYPFFTCSQNESKIDYYAFDTKAIVIAGNGDISVKYYEGKFNAYQRTYVLTPKNHFYLFLKECENSIGELKSTSQGSVIKFITKEMLENITITENNYACFFDEKLHIIYSQIMDLQHKIKTLKRLKTFSLKKYFG